MQLGKLVAWGLMLTFAAVAACKESPPPKNEAKEKEENAEPSEPPFQDPPPSPPVEEPDPCESNDSEESTEEESDSEDSESTDSESEDGEDPFGLRAKPSTKKVEKAAKPKVKTYKKTKKLKKAKVRHVKKANKPKPNKKSATAKASAKPGFSLAETVSWDSDIKSLYDGKCTSCHKSGGTPPDLSTYDKAKSALASSVSQVEDDKMPPSSPLSSSEKKKLTEWQNAGAPETSDSSDSDGDTETDTDTDSDSDSDSDSSSDCGDDGDYENEYTDGYEELLNPPELEECHDKGKVYDRKNGECHKAKIAEFSCDRSGVIEAFKKVGVDAGSRLSEIEGDGYKIDQCGIYEKEPIVYFIKQGEITGDSASLKIKKLCKPSASVCN